MCEILTALIQKGILCILKLCLLFTLKLASQTQPQNCFIAAALVRAKKKLHIDIARGWIDRQMNGQRFLTYYVFSSAKHWFVNC